VSAGPEIRPARLDELGQVLAAWVASGATPTATDDERGLRTLLDFDPTALLVAVEDGRVLGTVIAGWDGWRGTIHRLAVVPEARRRGIARLLVRAGEERLHDLGARRVNALVNVERGPAVGLWEVEGYSLDRRLGRFVKSV
jgi:ribosomal protein S18 acetylase RimI-like enzyme